MKKSDTQKAKERKAEAKLNARLEENSKAFSIRIVGEVFTPILKCAICGTQTEHHFVEIRKAPFMRYIAGALNPVPRFDKWSKPIEMLVHWWACSKCQTERIYGSA